MDGIKRHYFISGFLYAEILEAYINRYRFGLEENQKLVQDCYRELSEVRTAYGDFVGRKVGEDEWYEQVADFKHWYNTMYNPLEPVG